MDRLLLLGPPASGKGTQAKLLALRYNLPVASTGQMLLDQERRGTDIGRLSEQLRETGSFVPDQTILELVMHWIARHGTRFLFDGFPRTLVQAEAFHDCLCSAGLQLDAAIALDVPVDERRLRTIRRATCTGCGASFDRQDGRCPHCGGAGMRRADDADHVFDLRVALFHQHCDPVLDYYRRGNLLLEIDGAAGPGTVSDRLDRALLSSVGRCSCLPR